mmetsp:Transcript_33612/g.39149  ORF Transcript_33612/g.39149 Transcript_33612/m.39149 type:complete len:230 (-) Transcript_33612:638-1327(-)
MLVVAESKCHLECANGGHCIFDPNHIVSHLHHNIHNDFATGILRELCLCPIGYTGIACLTPTDSVEECHHLNGTHLCHNGGFCRQVLTSIDGGDDINVMEWKCDCLEADKVSSFAGAMCRNPHTDYCNDDGSAFCTNGGSCRSSLVSFDIDTEYMGSEGCLCPPEFSGPHCEFLTTLITEDNLPTIKTPELTPIEGETTTHNGIFFDKYSIICRSWFINDCWDISYSKK